MFPKSTPLLLCLLLTPVLQAAEEVNIYSSRQEQLIKPLLDKFSDASGITVNLITGKDDALIERLKLEGENSPADLLITADVGRLYRAKSMELTQAVESKVLEEAIPAHLRDPENQWFGLTYRARPIFYAKDKVKPEELSTYADLTNEKWKGRVCIRSSSNIYNQSLLASMIASQGEEAASAWATAFVKNFARPPAGGDRDQIKAVAAGECDIAVANTYYYGNMLATGDESEKAAANKVAIFWPDQGENERGTHINISGVALAKYAPNRDNAIKLLDFMVSDEAQTWYSEINHEYPVKASVESNALLKSWGDFKADSINLSELGKNNTAAVKIMDQADWK